MRKYKLKKQLDTFVAISVAVLCIILLLGGLLYVDPPLKSYPKSVGRILDKGIDFVEPPKGVRNKEVFFLQPDTPTIAMSYFRINQNYTDLLEKLWTGDTVTVYYSLIEKGRDRFEAELVQVEKNGVVVLPLREYQELHKEVSKVLGVIGGVGLAFTLAMLRNIWKPRRYKRRKTLPAKAS